MITIDINVITDLEPQVSKDLEQVGPDYKV